MKLFFDTSAFIKRYVDEKGSQKVQALLTDADEVGLSVLILPESLSTLTRLLREKRISQKNYLDLKKAIVTDVSQIDLCGMTTAVIEQTVVCLERNPLRAMDAIHLGSALVYQPDIFVSADHRQISAAKQEGLSVADVSS
ncbi:MAG: type II toxin-antitoxin system VapC family toxin [Gammaproteobacteria bacterium]|nr:type II toxin-antitoxin system VapC family toxin [Gammaproteobacteria bacterium]